MEFPKEIQMLIMEFARPLSKVNWRSGGSFNSENFYTGLRDRYKRTGGAIYEKALGRSRMSRNKSLIWSRRYMYT